MLFTQICRFRENTALKKTRSVLSDLSAMHSHPPSSPRMASEVTFPSMSSIPMGGEALTAYVKRNELQQAEIFSITKEYAKRHFLLTSPFPTHNEKRLWMKEIEQKWSKANGGQEVLVKPDALQKKVSAYIVTYDRLGTSC
jgi:hypothetical protein